MSIGRIEGGKPMATKQSFKFWQFLFSTHGRVSQKAFTLFEVPAALFLFAIPRLIRYMTMSGLAVRTTSGRAITETSGFHIYTIATVAFGLVSLWLLWPRFAVAAKRLHDIGLPWYIALLIFVQFATAIAFSVVAVSHLTSGPQAMASMQPLQNTAFYLTNLFVLVLCCLPTRPSASRYGPDPRRPTIPSDVF